MKTGIHRQPCAAHAAALVEYAEERVLSCEAAAALLHAERCSRCARELRATLLVVAQLRRLAAAAGAAGQEPRGGRGPDHWAVVRRRITSPGGGRASWSNPFMGPLLAAGVLAAVLAWGGGPMSIGGPGTGWDEPGAAETALTPSVPPEGGRIERPPPAARLPSQPFYEPSSGPSVPRVPVRLTPPQPRGTPRAAGFSAL